MNGVVSVNWIQHSDTVRLVVVIDDHFDIDNLKGDCYNPEVNPDIDPAKLKEEEEAFEQKVIDDGVYGILSQYKCPCCGEWKDVDSVWGFVGDDWKDSGYDADLIANAEKELIEKGSASC